MYQFPRLQILSGLVHGFSEKSDGNMSFRWGSHDEVLENRKKFLNKLNIPLEKCVSASLSHGLEIKIVSASDAGKGMTNGDDAVSADALMTDDKNIFLFLLTGDCLPIIFYDPDKEAAALAHLSRINTPLGLSSKMVGAMSQNYGSRPSDIIVGIGPGIHKESYLFSSEIVDKRGMRNPEWEPFLTDFPDGKTAVDIVEFNLEQLEEAGVNETNIEVSEIDTGSNENFFSHYRSKRITSEAEGRMAMVLGIVNI